MGGETGTGGGFATIYGTTNENIKYFPCLIARGIFDYERFVRISDFDKKNHHYFVDKDAVSIQKSLEKNEIVEGYVKVRVIEAKDDRTIINVPGETDTIIEVDSDKLKNLENKVVVG